MVLNAIRKCQEYIFETELLISFTQWNYFGLVFNLIQYLILFL